MIQNALAGAIVVYGVIVGVVLAECTFLAPYKVVIWAEYGEALMWSSGVLLLNLFAGIYGLLRKLALKDTGDKLSHLEKQLRGRETVSPELSDRILERQ